MCMTHFTQLHIEVVTLGRKVVRLTGWHLMDIQQTDYT
jgi:hypothetical protein